MGRLSLPTMESKIYGQCIRCNKILVLLFFGSCSSVYRRDITEDTVTSLGAYAKYFRTTSQSVFSHLVTKVNVQ